MGMIWWFALSAAGQAAPVPAAPMTADGFVERFGRVEAAMRNDMGALNREVRDAIVLYRADAAVARTAGRAPRGCLPEQGDGKVAFNDLATAFRALPPAARAMPAREALFAYFDRRYPCPAGVKK